MDERIQTYIEKRKEEIALEREKEKQQLLENLKLGERVYSDDSVCTLEYPLFDDSYDAKRKAYKIDTAQTLTEEEYDEIRRISKKGYGTSKDKEPSGWHTFATVMMFLGAVAVIISLFSCLSESSYRRDFTPFIITLGGYLVELGLWAIVQLLAKIEANTRKE